jgi:hypothetical protein
MTKEQIEQLALKAYPIDSPIDDYGNIDTSIDYNSYERGVYIEGLTKASELLYTEQEVEDAIKEGVNIGIRESKNPKAVRYNVVEREVKECLQSIKQSR